MAKTDFKSVDQYLSTQPEATRAVLAQVRGIIRKAVPAADEVISYQIPAYKLPGGVVVYFAGWKQHYSIYPATAGVVAAFADELAGYEVAKGTIRFPLGERVPARLIAGIVKLRARETAARGAAWAKRAPAQAPAQAAWTKAINARWHLAHRMPARPTPAQRVAWHVAHVEHCACRPMPDSVKALVAAARRKAKPGASSSRPATKKKATKPPTRAARATRKS